MSTEEKYQIIHEVGGLNGIPKDILDDMQDEIKKSDEKEEK